MRAMFVPSKTTALTNVLPAYADTIDWQSMIRDLQTKVDEPNLIYDLAENDASHNEEYIYYRTDHHWTSLGAYYAYRAWALQTGRKAKVYPISSAYLYLMIFMGLPIIRFMPVAWRMWWKI